jgi:hypothetical protein
LMLWNYKFPDIFLSYPGLNTQSPRRRMCSCCME